MLVKDYYDTYQCYTYFYLFIKNIMKTLPKWYEEALVEYHRCYDILGMSEPKNGDPAHDLGWQGQYGDIGVHIDKEFKELVEKYSIDDDRSAGKASKIIINTLKSSNLELFIGAVMGSLIASEEAPSFVKDFVSEKGFSSKKYIDTSYSILMESKESDIKEAYRLYVKYLMKYSPMISADTARDMYNMMYPPGAKYFGWDIMAAVNIITINIIHHHYLVSNKL